MQLVGLAESISSQEHSRVAVVLAILADIMAHTQRITLAEGLFRCLPARDRTSLACQHSDWASCEPAGHDLLICLRLCSSANHCHSNQDGYLVLL